jgi:ferric-dicitrate binding protein FerR (iron transport regulator)
VRAYPNEKASETALIRGQIIVTLNKDNSKEYILKPAQKLRVDDDMVAANRNEASPTRITTGEYRQPVVVMDKIKYSQVDSQVIETAWLKDRLEFEDETFREVADKMEHWYGVTIKFTDKKLENEVLKGSFINESLSAALAYLSYTTRFDYTVSGNEITIKPRK